MKQYIQGFSLLEVMLAGVLGLLLIASIGELILSVFRVSQAAQQKAEVAENAQYLLGLFKRELNMVGFYGDYNLTSANKNRPDICSLPSKLTMQLALSYPVDGINNMPINQRLCGRDVILQDTDVLLLRQGTSVSHTQPEPVSVWKQTIYYVAEDRSFKRRRYIDEPNNTKRSKNITEPIIEGVDDFQVEYGIKYTDQSGVTTEFIELPQNEQQWSQLVEIRFYLLLSSTTKSPRSQSTQTYHYANKIVEMQDNKHRGLFTGISLFNNLDPQTLVFDIAM